MRLPRRRELSVCSPGPALFALLAVCVACSSPAEEVQAPGAGAFVRDASPEGGAFVPETGRPGTGDYFEDASPGRTPDAAAPTDAGHATDGESGSGLFWFVNGVCNQTDGSCDADARAGDCPGSEPALGRSPFFEQCEALGDRCIDRSHIEFQLAAAVYYRIYRCKGPASRGTDTRLWTVAGNCTTGAGGSCDTVRSSQVPSDAGVGSCVSTSPLGLVYSTCPHLLDACVDDANGTTFTEATEGGTASFVRWARCKAYDFTLSSHKKTLWFDGACSLGATGTCEGLLANPHVAQANVPPAMGTECPDAPVGAVSIEMVGAWMPSGYGRVFRCR